MATTHFLSGTNPVIRQTPLPWRLPNHSTPPRFNLKFRPFMSTAHSINPFKLSLRCAAKPPLNPKSQPDTQPEDLDPLRLVGGFMGTILDALNELRAPDEDPDLTWVDDFVDTVLDAVELKIPPSKQNLEADTRCGDSDPVRVDDPMGNGLKPVKEVMNPPSNPEPKAEQSECSDPNRVEDSADTMVGSVNDVKSPPSNPNPDPDHIHVEDIKDAILKAVEELKSRPSIRVEDINTILEAVEELKNPPSTPKPNADTQSEYSDPNRVEGLVDTMEESVNELKNPPSNPKPDPEVEDIMDTIVDAEEELKNRLPIWVDDIMDTVMKAVEELKNPPSNPKRKADTQSEYSDAIRVNDIVDTILKAVKELKKSPSNNGWVDDIVDTIMNYMKDSQPEDLYQILVTSIIRNVLKNPAIAVVLMQGWSLMSDLFSNLAPSGGRMGGSSSSSISYRSSSSGSGQDLSWEDIACIIAFLCFLVASDIVAFETTGESIRSGRKKTTVVTLQVGLSGSAKSSLQRALNEIAETANASTPEGLSYILTESTVALLRHSDYYISASSFVDVETTVEKGEMLLNRFSIEERGKFDEETLVNVNNLRRKRRTGLKSEGKFSNEYIVMTILVAAEGEHKLPTINGVKDLKDALQKLGSIPSCRIAAVEVMWTPQEENDVLSEKELAEDYPHLKPIS